MKTLYLFLTTQHKIKSSSVKTTRYKTNRVCTRMDDLNHFAVKLNNVEIFFCMNHGDQSFFFNLKSS